MACCRGLANSHRPETPSAKPPAAIGSSASWTVNLPRIRLGRNSVNCRERQAISTNIVEGFSTSDGCEVIRYPQGMQIGSTNQRRFVELAHQSSRSLHRSRKSGADAKVGPRSNLFNPVAARARHANPASEMQSAQRGLYELSPPIGSLSEKQRCHAQPTQRKYRRLRDGT